MRHPNEPDVDINGPKSDDWVLMTDGLTTNRGVGVGYVLISLNDHQLKYALALSFCATNNEAKYQALIIGLLIARGASVTQLHIKCDSQLVVH